MNSYGLDIERYSGIAPVNSEVDSTTRKRQIVNLGGFIVGKSLLEVQDSTDSLLIAACNPVSEKGMVANLHWPEGEVLDAVMRKKRLDKVLEAIGSLKEDTSFPSDDSNTFVWVSGSYADVREKSSAIQNTERAVYSSRIVPASNIKVEWGNTKEILNLTLDPKMASLYIETRPTPEKLELLRGLLNE